MQRKLSVNENADVHNKFLNNLFLEEVDGYRLVYDKRNNVIVKKNKGSIIDLEKDDWRIFCNTIIDRMSNQGTQDSIFTEYKKLSPTELTDKLEAIRNKCAKGSLDDRIESYDELLNEWVSIPWDGIKRLDKKLFNYKFDYNGAGNHLLKKVIIEMILWSRGLKMPQMFESYVLIGTQGVGKSSLLKCLLSEKNRYKYIRSLESGFTVKSLYDKLALFGKSVAVELEEMSAAKGDPEILKCFMVEELLTARNPRTLDEKTAPRKFVIVGTSNKNQCIPQDAAGRRWIPVKIDSVNPEIGKDGKQLRNWLIVNRDQLFAEAIHLLDIDKVNPETLYPCYNDNETESLALQEKFIVSRHIKNEGNVFVLEEALADYVNYGLTIDAIKELFQSNNNNETARTLKDLGWTNSKINNKRVWVSEDYAFSNLSQKEQSKYFITLDHVKNKLPFPTLPNKDLPEKPTTETDLEVLPQPNIEPKEALKLFESNDSELKGQVLRVVDVGYDTYKYCIIPNLVDHKTYEELKESNKKESPYGSLNDDIVKAAQFLFFEFDSLTKLEQYAKIQNARKYFPIRLINDTGNKSLQAYIPLDPIIKNMEYFRKLQQGLSHFMDSDTSIINPGRPMAHPTYPNPKTKMWPRQWVYEDEAVDPKDLDWLLKFIPKKIAPKPKSRASSYKYPNAQEIFNNTVEAYQFGSPGSNTYTKDWCFVGAALAFAEEQNLLDESALYNVVLARPRDGQRFIDNYDSRKHWPSTFINKAKEFNAI